MEEPLIGNQSIPMHTTSDTSKDDTCTSTRAGTLLQDFIESSLIMSSAQPPPSTDVHNVGLPSISTTIFPNRIANTPPSPYLHLRPPDNIPLFSPIPDPSASLNQSLKNSPVSFLVNKGSKNNKKKRRKRES